MPRLVMCRIRGRPVLIWRGPSMYVGLDVHKEAFAVADDVT